MQLRGNEMTTNICYSRYATNEYSHNSRPIGLNKTNRLPKESKRTFAHHKKILLIVNEDTQVLQNLSSELKDNYDQVLTSKNLQNAKWLLANVVVSHVICGNNICGSESGCDEMLSRWRSKYPRLRHAVVYSNQK